MHTRTFHSSIQDQHHTSHRKIRFKKSVHANNGSRAEQSSRITASTINHASPQPNGFEGKQIQTFNWIQVPTLKQIHSDPLDTKVTSKAHGDKWNSSDDGASRMETDDHRWRLTVPARRRRSIRVFPEYVGDQRGQVSGSTSRRKKLEEAK